MLLWSQKIRSLAILALVTSVTCLATAEDAKKDEAKKEEKPAVKTQDVDVKGLTLKLPETWKKMPLGPLQVANYEVPAADDDKEPSQLAVFHFENGGGGGLQANIDRYTKQFDADERKLKILEGESAHGKYTLIDLSGTWTRPFQKEPVKKPNTRMLAVVLHTEKNGDYFVRLTGPNKTVTENAAKLRAAIAAKADKETERKGKDEAK
ncbi:MAG: hypothetical protein JWM11_63 [Planctomycetaceae bacterium]|nr:hypothetical protein [Planctomycetaceae bacterium]